jgi:solute carrier family 30 (zinc transporter), member 1
VTNIATLGHGHSHHDHAIPRGDGPKQELDLVSHKGHAHTLALSQQDKAHADIGILGVLIHLIGDAINNVAVMIAAGVALATGFIYADPIASAFVGIMIVATSLPLVFRSGRLLLDSAPGAVDFEGVGKDIMNITGIEGVHEMHIWNLSEFPVHFRSTKFKYIICSSTIKSTRDSTCCNF